MAEKIVKICDRCKAESVLYNTASWETCTFHKLALGNPTGDSVKYDLCAKCANLVKVYIIETAASSKEGGGDG